MKHVATCHVIGCENNDIPVELLDNPAPLVMCGGCGEFITDVVPPIPEPDPEPEPSNVVFQGVNMQPFSTESGYLDIEPDRQVVVFADQPDVHPQVDRNAGTVTFIRMDGLTPELVTGWVGVSE